MHTAQSILGLLGGMLHVTLHEAQQGGIIVLLRPWGEESRAESGQQPWETPPSLLSTGFQAHPQLPLPKSPQLLTGRGQERQEGSNENDPGLHGPSVPAKWGCEPNSKEPSTSPL